MGDDVSLTFWQFSQEIVIPRLLEGLGLTVQLTLLSGVCGIVLGMIIAVARISRNPVLRYPAALYVTVVRGTPLLLQVLFVYFALPPLIDIRLDAFPAGVLALSLNAAAYFTEIFRAAIQSIDKGQMEAARALGMGYAVAMRRIVIPQTYRRLIPPIVNELSALAKDTSLVSSLALAEVLYITQRVSAKYLRPWEVYIWAAACYLVIVLMFSAIARYCETHLARRES